MDGCFYSAYDQSGKTGYTFEKRWKYLSVSAIYWRKH